MALNQNVQTAVSLYAGSRYVGQIDTLQINNTTDAVLETAAVGVGLAVARGSADGIVKPFNASDADFAGVIVRKHTQTNTYNDNTAPDYEVGNTPSILNFGYIVVEAESTVAKGDDVYIRYAAGAGGTVLGSFRNDADTASAALVAGLVFAESANAGDMVRLCLTRIYE